ncbi:MAG: hypothetical protein Q7J05_03365 [Paludibacter sp.]|nr:hypothetical protein [Paludibacter sp.]
MYIIIVSWENNWMKNKGERIESTYAAKMASALPAPQKVRN